MRGQAEPARRRGSGCKPRKGGAAPGGGNSLESAPVFHYGCGFVPQDIWPRLDPCLVSIFGTRSAIGTWWGESRGVTEHSARHRTVLCNQELSVQSISSAESEKPHLKRQKVICCNFPFLLGMMPR